MISTEKVWPAPPLISSLYFCRVMKTGWDRMMSHLLDFLGEGAQNQRQQASSCGAKFSPSGRAMEQRYLHTFVYALCACQVFH